MKSFKLMNFRIISLFISFLITVSCFGNMGSPYSPGTYASSAVTSKKLDILSEKIHIVIDKKFKTAKYKITYQIQSDTTGWQVPLLFVALQNEDDFKILFDGQPVYLSPIAYRYENRVDSIFASFANDFFDTIIVDSAPYNILWDKDENPYLNFSDYKYFKIDFTPGVHIIQVEYTGDVWIDESGWVKKYSFRYSLSPAKQWRSFKNLELILDATAFFGNISTNLEEYKHTTKNKVYKWKFDHIPKDFILIEFNPEISWWSKILIGISPFGIALFFVSIYTFISYQLNKNYRMSYYSKRFSPIVFITALLSPVLFPLFILLGYHVIYSSIDSHATDGIPYLGLVLVLPLFCLIIVMPVYLSILWYWDWTIRDNYREANDYKPPVK